MKIITPSTNIEYELIDSGDGKKLEQFGNNLIVRPDQSCIWHPTLRPAAWNRARAACGKGAKNNFSWTSREDFTQDWNMSYTNEALSEGHQALKFALRPNQNSKNVGIFPEQAAHWDWFIPLIRSALQPVRLLNLFAYTGGATLCAAAAGAQVCHVDASKAAITWARNNAMNNNLATAPIRWIPDDCLEFMRREVKRGARYDALIADPPAFGRDPQGNIFHFEDAIHELLELAAKLLEPRPLFVVVNGYGMQLAASALANIVADYFPQAAGLEFGELGLKQKESTKVLSCNIFVRFAESSTVAQ